MKTPEPISSGTSGAAVTRAGNQDDALHDEGYEQGFDLRNLNHGGMIFMGGRRSEPLAGRWHFTLDRFDTGLRQHWYRDCEIPARQRTAPWDYDLDNGVTIDVPSCWNLKQPEYRFYEGSAWYGRRFAYQPARAGERLFLRIGAASYDCKVFLNGRFLGSHVGGSTPFFVEMTHQASRDNLLMLCVNNERRLDRVPMRNMDWFNYGGLFREVELIRLDPVFIKDMVVNLLPDCDFSRISLVLTLSDPVAGKAHIAMPALGGDRVVEITAGQGELIIDASPELWEPKAPVLYQVEASFGGDRVADRIGLREIRVEGGDILLNGKPIRLLGVGVHEDDVQEGRCASEADIRRRFAHAQELGANFMRLAHYPHHELTAKIADEIGMLLWQEIPVYWSVAFDRPSTMADADNQLRELILRDRNRASVIVWGIGNENADTDERLRFMSALAKTARQLDPSRLISAACLVNRASRQVDDRLAAVLDLVAINEYYGWYEPDIDDLVAIGRNYTQKKPLIISEMGADGPAGRHGAPDELFTEEQMDACYQKQFAAMEQMPALRGVCPWILYDFRSERRQNQFQRGYNRKGLIADDKATKKKAFWTVRRYYDRWSGKTDEGSPASR